MNTHTKQLPEDHPWLEARRLGKELSETLALCDGGRWAAHIVPVGAKYSVGFSSIEGGDHPAQVVERLSVALSEALNDYCGGRFHVRIFPSDQGGYGFYFAGTVAHDREGL